MNRKTMFKLTPVAASLLVAMSGVAHAAAPAANALPGTFLTNQSGITYNISGGNGTIASITGNTVLQFGGTTAGSVVTSVAPTIASGATASTVAGFNIGASAALQLNASASGANVLVSDLTGQASNIYGSLTANNNVAGLFIANPNGVVVGGSANIAAGNVALVGYQADAASFSSTVATVGGIVTVGVVGGTAPSITGGGSAGSTTSTNGGAVTVSNGATVNAGYLLVAGAGQVNLGAYAGTVTNTVVAAGSGVVAGSGGATLGTAVVSTSAVANLGGNTGTLTVNALGAAGAVNVLSSVALNNATVGGTLTNNANMTLGGTTNVASLTNNANAVVNAGSFGNVTNNANLSATSALNFGGAFVNSGKATVSSLSGVASGTAATATVSNAGVIIATATGGLAATGSLASFNNTGSLYDSGNGVTIVANAINLGGTVAANATAATVGAVTLGAATGDLIGSANLTSSKGVTLTASKGSVNYSGNIAATSAVATATTGAVALGAVNVGTSGTVNAQAGNGSVTLNGNITANTATLAATGGSVLINKNITLGGGLTASADNQVMVYGNVNAGTAGTVSLSTNKVWTGAYNLGVVIMPSGGVTAGTVSASVGSTDPVSKLGGNMLQYGGLAATAGFNFSGNSYYQGAGAAINTPAATFGYGNASAGGAIAGGIVYGSANPQPSNAFFNAVMVGGSNVTNSTTGVNLYVVPNNLGSAKQNVNLMGIGNTTLTAYLPTSMNSLFGSTASTVINTGFVPSNLFIRAQGGNLTLSQGLGSSSFYWPGLVYASTVQSGMVATVDTTKTINVVSSSTPGALSNALPYQATGGAGMYLMTGKINSGDITVNTNSNVNVLNPLQVAGLNLYTASAPTGLVLNYSATLPTANLVSYTPPAN